MKLPNVKLVKRTNETLPAAAKMHPPKYLAKRQFPVAEKLYLSRKEKFEIHDSSPPMVQSIKER